MNTSHNPEQRRIVVLDTETTGMNREGGPHYMGHRIIEIGAVEIINRKLTGRHFHVYLKPDMPIQPDAIDVHGITDEFLLDKPVYKQVHDEFLDFIKGAELVAHNAPFDVGFMDHEFGMLDARWVPLSNTVRLPIPLPWQSAWPTCRREKTSTH